MDDNSLPKKPAILIIDDEEGIRLSAKYILENSYDVTTADKTDAAREILEKVCFDLAFLDLWIKNEPMEACIDLLKHMTEKYPKMPVVILTGTVSWVQKWDELRRLGAKDFMSKPFDRFDIMGMAEKVLKGK